MINKDTEPERAGRDRWLVSYADFMTLLCAFFVVMYALSSINTEKYEVYSKAISSSFPASLKKLQMLSNAELQKFISIVESSKDGSVIDDSKVQADPGSEKLEENDLAKIIQNRFQYLIQAKKIKLKTSEDWFEVEVGSNLLFNSGGAFLNNESEIIITGLAEILKPMKHSITIEGFTDNVPISNPIYPSNWELSADRAASVARAFVAAGISESRLSITGYGENFPIADNNTTEGKQNNRRIVIVIEKENKRKNYLATHK